MTHFPSRRAGVTLAALVSLLLSTALTGCNPNQLGAAATVEGETFSIEELHDITEDYLAIAPNFDKSEAQRQILNRRIATAVIARAAEDVGASVSRAEVAEDRDRILQELGGRKKLIQTLAQLENPEVLPPRFINQWAHDRLLVNRVAEQVAKGRDPNQPEVGQEIQQAFVAAASALSIEVNPRYGTWDPKQLDLAGQVGGGLSKSLAERTDPKRTAPELTQRDRGR